MPAIMPHTCMHRRHHKHERTHVPSPSPLFLFGSSTEWDKYLIVCVVDGRRTVEARVIVAAAAAVVVVVVVGRSCHVAVVVTTLALAVGGWPLLLPRGHNVVGVRRSPFDFALLFCCSVRCSLLRCVALRLLCAVLLALALNDEGLLWS